MKTTAYLLIFVACIICSGETPMKESDITPSIQKLEQKQLDNHLKLNRLNATFD